MKNTVRWGKYVAVGKQSMQEKPEAVENMGTYGNPRLHHPHPDYSTLALSDFPVSFFFFLCLLFLHVTGYGMSARV